MGAELVRDARFWVAAVLLLKTVLFYAVPTFPPEVWGAVDGLLAVVIGAMAGEGATRLALMRRQPGGMRAASERGLAAAERYQADGQDVAALLGLTLLGVGLALFDVRWALLGIGGLLLGFALVGALVRGRGGE